MLIEAARRAEAAVKEMLAVANDGAATTEQLRDALAISKSVVGVISAFQTSAAAAVAGRERHGDGGAEVLAGSAGLSRLEARSQVKTAEALREVPAAREAVESGRVSPANAKRTAEAIDKTTADTVGDDGELLAKAESMRPEQFTKEARRWVVDCDGDGGESEHQRQRTRRCVRLWDGDDGMVHVRGEFDTVTGRRIGNRLRTEAGRLHDADKKNAAAGGTERRTFAQCMADAFDNLTAGGATGSAGSLADAARTFTSTGNDAGPSRTGRTFADPPPASPSTRNRANGASPNSTGEPLADLPPASPSTRNRASGGTGPARPFDDICVVAHVDDRTGRLVAELPDGTRLPPSVLEELACNAKFTGIVYGRAGKPIWRAHSVRTATEAQRQILLARHGGCFHCAAHPALCQIHHIKPVSEGGTTRLDNMVPVCWDCHQRIHHRDWQIRTANGVHTLHPPGRVTHGPARAPNQPILRLPAAESGPAPQLRWADTGGTLCYNVEHG